MAAKFLGQFLLEQGLIDRQQLLDALDAQRRSNPVLGELAQALGMLDYIQTARIHERQRRDDKRFGDVALDMGLLTGEQVGTLLDQQKRRRRLFGDILVERGALSREQLQQSLQAQRHDRDEAHQALALQIAHHASGKAMASAIDTCARLFPRLIGSRCQFSGLVHPAGGPDGGDLDKYRVCARVDVQAQRPLWIGLAAEPAVATDIACAFMSLPQEACEPALAEDALGELVNVLMGYVAKDAFDEADACRVTPPRFDLAASQLAAAPGALAVALVSEPGTLLLLVGT